MTKTPAQVVDDLLATTPPKKSRSTIAAKPELAAAIEQFLKLKAAADARVVGISLAWFYNNKLRATFSGPTMDAVRIYVRETLKRDITTGKVIK